MSPSVLDTNSTTVRLLPARKSCNLCQCDRFRTRPRPPHRKLRRENSTTQPRLQRTSHPSSTWYKAISSGITPDARSSTVFPASYMATKYVADGALPASTSTSSPSPASTTISRSNHIAIVGAGFAVSTVSLVHSCWSCVKTMCL